MVVGGGLRAYCSLEVKSCPERQHRTGGEGLWLSIRASRPIEWDMVSDGRLCPANNNSPPAVGVSGAEDSLLNR